MDGNIMETRNILDINGNIIGELSLPENTSEEIWTQKLSEYLIMPSVPEHKIADITSRQIRHALIISEVSLQQIEDTINSLEEPNKSLARAEWEHTCIFQRDKPLISQVNILPGWTEEQLDNLWIMAGKL